MVLRAHKYFETMMSQLAQEFPMFDRNERIKVVDHWFKRYKERGK